MQTLPPDFRQKHDQLLGVIDSRTGRPVTDSLRGPDTVRRLENLPNGATRHYFYGGGLYLFDRTGRYPVVAVWGKVHSYYDNLGNIDSGFGRPLTDLTDLSDGGRCCIFEGGHIHEYGEEVSPFPASHCVAPYQPQAPVSPFGTGPAGMPPVFHQKWVALSLQKGADGRSIIDHLSRPSIRLKQNDNGGQLFNFLGGNLVTIDNQSPPVVIYGKFNSVWHNVGDVTGGLGRPLMDPRDIDGGRCQVFEGGHLHEYHEVIHTCAPDRCSSQYSPQPPYSSWNAMPPHFRDKWTALCSVVHAHTGNTIAEMLGRPCLLLRDNPDNIGGEHYDFLGGLLVSLSQNPMRTPFNKAPMVQAHTHTRQPSYPAGDQFQHDPKQGYILSPTTQRPTLPPFPSPSMPSPYDSDRTPATSTGPPAYQPGSPRGFFPNGPQHVPGMSPAHGGLEIPLVLQEPFYIVGPIRKLWRDSGGFGSTYGRPLCDEQDLPDGGRCSIFEGAHIHLYNGEARGVPAHQCTAPYQPTAPSRPNVNPPPAQPTAKPPMTVSPVHVEPEEKSTGCCALLRLCCICKCEQAADGKSGHCKLGECVCCTWHVH